MSLTILAPWAFHYNLGEEPRIGLLGGWREAPLPGQLSTRFLRVNLTFVTYPLPSGNFRRDHPFCMNSADMEAIEHPTLFPCHVYAEILIGTFFPPMAPKCANINQT
jgi:hypothetical protein